MAATMKIKKGDTVQILAGKDRGKQGRVIEARPSEGRVITFRFSTSTRPARGRASMMRPCLPRSLPARICTMSPCLIFILFATFLRAPREPG